LHFVCKISACWSTADYLSSNQITFIQILLKPSSTEQQNMLTRRTTTDFKCWLRAGSPSSVVQSQGWERISHGTGMGHSSTAGYWIPKQLLQVAPQPKAYPPSKKRKAGSGASGKPTVSKGRGNGSSRRVARPPRAVSQQVGDATAPAGRHLGEIQVGSSQGVVLASLTLDFLRQSQTLHSTETYFSFLEDGR
jgi:hypothetical protein